MPRKKHNKNNKTLSFQAGIPVEQFTEIISSDELKKIRTISVAWGIPCDELSYSKFWTLFERNSYKMPWDDWITSEGTYLQKSRNYIHNTFLTQSDTHYLMMLDSDILFPPHLVEMLMSHDLPIVGGWYRDKKAENHHPAVYDFVEDKDDMPVFRHRNTAGKGVEKVDAMGAGCWLMSRSVAEELGEYPYGHNIAGGEDFRLCRKLMELNIPLHVDWSINCAHIGVGIT